VPGLADVRPLGRGGFGVVYRAWQVNVGREVALKVDGRILVDERDRHRFLREASTAGRLSGHPNIVAVHDAGVTDDGRPYLVMELCPNGSLADRVDDTGPMRPEEVRRIGVGIADALAIAYAENILHRDVKPPNILVDAYGTAKLGDFGLAAIVDASGDSSVTREALTPAFAPPEAFAMARPEPSGDVYSLAATLYCLLSGVPPRQASWPPRSFADLERALRAPVRAVAGVHPALFGVLLDALDPDPHRRTPGAAEFRDALAYVPAEAPAGHGYDTETLRRSQRGPSGPPPPSTPPPPPVVRDRDGRAERSDRGDGGRYDERDRAGAQLQPERIGRLTTGGRRRAKHPVPASRRLAITLTIVAVLCAIAGIGYVVHRNGEKGGGGQQVAAGPTGSPGTGTAAGPRQATQVPIPARKVAPAGFAACDHLAPGALCTTVPRCWGGLVILAGTDISARPLGCEQPHYWQTYAAGRLPADAVGLPLEQIAARTEVARVCTPAMMAARTVRGRRTAGWEREIFPQQIRGQTDWIFHCLAGPPEGGEWTGSAFTAR
jgi:hypothetical protein